MTLDGFVMRSGGVQPRVSMVSGLEEKLNVKLPDLSSPEAKDVLWELVPPPPSSPRSPLSRNFSPTPLRISVQKLQTDILHERDVASQSTCHIGYRALCGCSKWVLQKTRLLTTCLFVYRLPCSDLFAGLGA